MINRYLCFDDTKDALKALNLMNKHFSLPDLINSFQLLAMRLALHPAPVQNENNFSENSKKMVESMSNLSFEALKLVISFSIKVVTNLDAPFLDMPNDCSQSIQIIQTNSRRSDFAKFHLKSKIREKSERDQPPIEIAKIDSLREKLYVLNEAICFLLPIYKASKKTP